MEKPQSLVLKTCMVGAALILAAIQPACYNGENPPSRFTNSIRMEFVHIPAGSFTMGSSTADLQRMMRDFHRATGRPYRKEWQVHVRDELPAHRVRITRGFYCQIHEVTNDQFAAFVDAAGYRTTAEAMGGGWTFGDQGWVPVPGADWRHPLGPDTSISGKGGHPVVQVSWTDAIAFCNWLSQKESKTYRLPSEAQWEYACRGGRLNTLYPWGEEMPPVNPVANMPDEAYARQVGKERYHVAGYDDGYADSAPVGNYAANGFGLYDMIGNVWEWCADRYGKEYYVNAPESDPEGPPEGRHRVLRGGAFCFLPSNQRCADRFRNLESFRSHFTGFRVVQIVQ